MDNGLPVHDTDAVGAPGDNRGSLSMGDASNPPVHAGMDGAPGDDGEGTTGSAPDAGSLGFDGAAVRALAADDTDSDG